ncbi:MAG: pyridoxal-phosphate dependent enzyme [Melioribacteraceae bacterium]
MNIFEKNPIVPIQKITFPRNDIPVNVFMKRDDLTDIFISGNKYYKLKYNVLYALENNIKKLISFGGAYSNHIHAFSYACKLFGFDGIGIIRGELTYPINPTLKFAAENGMKIEYLSRSEYRLKHTDEFKSKLIEKYGEFLYVPEGGSNELAIKGAAEILDNVNIEYDYVTLAAGTGGTAAGVISSLKGEKFVYVFPVLKGSEFLRGEVNKFINLHSSASYNNYDLVKDFHFGGYAKTKPELFYFIDEFYELNEIQLDPVYTGKMMFGLNESIKSGLIPEGKTVLAIHTGGLQGIEGMNHRLGNQPDIYF